MLQPAESPYRRIITLNGMCVSMCSFKSRDAFVRNGIVEVWTYRCILEVVIPLGPRVPHRSIVTVSPVVPPLIDTFPWSIRSRRFPVITSRTHGSWSFNWLFTYFGPQTHLQPKTTLLVCNHIIISVCFLLQVPWCYLIPTGKALPRLLPCLV